MIKARTQIIALSLLFIFFGMVPELSAESDKVEADALVAPALEAAFSGDLKKAGELLEQGTSAAQSDPLVLWNLASVRARQDRLGDALHAVLQLLAVQGPDSLESKAVELRGQIVKRLFQRARRSGNPDVFAIRDPRSLTERWVLSLAPEEWRWLLYGSFWLLMLLLLLGKRGPPLVQTVHTTLLILGIVGSIVGGASDWASRNWIRPSKVGVVRLDEAPLHHSLVKGARIDRVPEGVVLSVLEKLPDVTIAEGLAPGSFHVRLPDGREGYMAPTSLGVVR